MEAILFNDKNIKRIEALEEEVKEQKQELERTLSMFNSLLKRCNHLSEQNAQLKKIATEDRKFCERQFASIDRVLEKHSFRNYGDSALNWLRNSHAAALATRNWDYGDSAVILAL